MWFAHFPTPVSTKPTEENSGKNRIDFSEEMNSYNLSKSVQIYQQTSWQSHTLELSSSLFLLDLCIYNELNII